MPGPMLMPRPCGRATQGATQTHTHLLAMTVGAAVHGPRSSHEHHSAQVAANQGVWWRSLCMDAAVGAAPDGWSGHSSEDLGEAVLGHLRGGLLRLPVLSLVPLPAP